MKKRRDNSDGRASELKSSGEVAGRDGDSDAVEIIEDDSEEQLRCGRFKNVMLFFLCFPSSTDVSFSCNVFSLCVLST